MRTYLIAKAIFVITFCLGLALYAESGPGRKVAPGGPVQAAKAPKKELPKLKIDEIDKINIRLYAIENVLSELSSRISKLTEVVSSPGGGTPAPIPPVDVDIEEREEPPAEVLSILSRNCAQCHAPPLIKEAGGGFAMFSDPSETGKELKLLKLSPEDWVRIDYSIYSGDMPQFADPLPSEDTAEVRAYINTFRGEIYRALSRDGTR